MCAFGMPTAAQRDELIAKLWDRRVIMLASGPDSVRFRPALTASRTEIDAAIDAVRAVLVEHVRAQPYWADRARSGGGSSTPAGSARSPPTSTQPCNSASLRAAGVKSWLVTTMVLVQSCIGCARHDLLHRAGADRSGLAFALHGKPIRAAGRR